jgi:hypothetical protein
MKRKFALLLATALAVTSSLKAQLNVELLHQLVEHSKDEHGRQQTARNRQAVNLANEEVNRGQMASLKSTYRDIQSRFRTLGTALEALGTGMQSVPILNAIYGSQRQCIELAADHPEFIPLALAAERELVERARQLARYLTGLFISIGDLNQMKASDRRILFGHVITELRAISGSSRALAASLGNAARRKAAAHNGALSDFHEKDRQIVDAILSRVKAGTQ